MLIAERAKPVKGEQISKACLLRQCVYFCGFKISIVQDWAVHGDAYNLGMSWYVPTPETTKFASDIVERFLAPQLEKINSLTPDNTSTVSK